MIPALLLALPLLSAALILLFTRRWASFSSWISVGSVTASLALAFLFLGAEDGVVTLFSWISIEGVISFDIGVTIDRLSRGMMMVVTVVGTLVHWYSLGYMKDDEGKARYFAGLSLFMFSMTGIVLADSFVMMFLFWELVGVSSYILIGHWYTKDSAADAAKKAFLTNRIGDFGFMAGILLLWGLTGSVAFSGIEEGIGAAGDTFPALVFAAALCIFCGAVGKSAQVPLHVWLPDAMEGPTPVSALIHAATMVAAGVYMLVRVDFLIAASLDAAEVIAWVGGITALVAALMATQQDDIKRVLAYSTLSQLGYMVMAVGLLAPGAAMFHLFTHAFFKALLFLGSGAMIYACHHEQDMWKMGGLAKRMPVTFLTFLIGTAALIAIPFTSGFFSKEAILAAAHEHNKPLFWIAVGVAFLTTFYMLRLVLVAFFGKARGEGADHAHEVPNIMRIPLVILALPSLCAGFTFFHSPLQATVPAGAHGLHFDIVFGASLLALIGGSAFALVIYGKSKDRDPIRIGAFANRFYIDELYAGLIKVFQDGLAVVAKFLDDYLIGGLLVRGGSASASGIGNVIRRLQSGNLQAYAFLFALGVILLIYFTVFNPA